MANPSKQRPFVIEAEYTPGKWYSVEAYRDRAEAKAMLPVFKKRVKGVKVRLRDIRETTVDS